MLSAATAAPGCNDTDLIEASRLVAIAITPESVTLETGGTQQFAVSGRMSDGSSTQVAVTFAATGGTVSTSGLYAAPIATGSFEVIAQQLGGTFADTSLVLVTSPTTAGLPNECATPKPGWIWCDDFDQDRLASYFEVDGAKGAFTRTAGAGNGGSWAMRAHFAAGAVSVGSLKVAFGRTPSVTFRPVDGGTVDHRELYWRVYLRNQPGWVGGGGDKLSRMMVLATGGWAQAMMAHLWSGGTTSRDYLVLDPASGTDVQGNLKTTVYNDFPNIRWLGAVRGATPLFGGSGVGTWHCVEAHVRLNDAGQSNGLFELWVDGNLDAQARNLNWLGGYSAYGLNAVFLENYWNAGSPVAQDRFLDNVIVGRAPIGC
jgi:hypothetical protein